MHGLDILTQLFLLCVAIGTVALLWARVVAPMLHAFGIRHPALDILYVKQEEPQAPQPEQTGRQTQTDGLSDALHGPETNDNDITPLNIPPGSRALLIEALVVAGWTLDAIRNTIKGDNATIGLEVKAAREKHNIKGRTITVTESGKAREIEL